MLELTGGKLIWQGSDDQFFELLTKVIFYTGFSRQVVARRWDAFRAAFSQFSIEEVAQYDDQMIERLLAKDSGIVKNARKVQATVANAGVCMALRKEHGTLLRYCEEIVEGGKSAGCSRLIRAFRLVGESAAASLWAQLCAEDGDARW